RLGRPSTSGRGGCYIRIGRGTLPAQSPENEGFRTLPKGEAMKVSVEGADLSCSVRGEGPVCLVLCSMGTRAHEWLTPDAWSDRFRLVFVDLRGSGESTGDPRDLTFDVLASDLEAVRRAAGAERAAI